MALLYPLKPAVFNRGQLYPANIYARPALGPYYRGLRGFGQAQRTNVQTFEETLRQFATTPFAVNSATYMEKIRERYGFNDEQLQNTLGTIGGIVGAGTTAAIQGGLFLGSRGISLDNTLAGSRRNAQAAAGFRRYTTSQIESINKYNTQAAKVADAVKNFNTAFENKKTIEATLSAAQETYDKVKYYKNTNPKKLKALQDLNDAKKAFEDINKTVDNLNSIRKSTIVGAKESAEKLARVGVDVAQEAIEAGEAVGRRAAGLTPLLGLGVDVASLGLSAAGLVQDLRAGDIGSAVLSSIETLGDFTAVLGDIVEYTPAAPIGTIISAVGSLISTAVSAMRVGYAIGESIGRSLSPSGLKAQELFAQNLASNIAARPVSTIAALTAQIAIPYFIGRAGSRYTGATVGNKLLYGLPRFLGENAIGNQIRAGLTMFVSQSIAPLTRQIDEALPTYNPEGSDFVSAISLFGDIQDNLYGATRTKSILLGLADNDPNAKRDALARAWGYSDKPAYVLTAADIIEKTDVLKDAPPIVKSVLGVVGEIVLDPRNFDEMVQSNLKTSRTKMIGTIITKELQRVEIAESIGVPGVKIKNGLEKLVSESNRGLFARTNLPTTQRLIYGAVNAYLTEGYKGLTKYLMEQSVQQNKGFKIGNLSFDVDGTAKILEATIKDIIGGTYRSALTVNNKEVQRLAAEVKRKQAILTEYDKTGKLPDNVTKSEIDNWNKFIQLVGMRYGSFDMDVVGTKIIKDLKLKLNLADTKKYYEASDAFANYMTLTDKLNAGLIFALNPIGRLIQLGEGRLLRNFNDKTRQTMATEKERMRIIESLDETIKNLKDVPTVDALKKAMEENKLDVEESLKLILAPNRALTRQEELLISNIMTKIQNDPEFAKINQEAGSRVSLYQDLIDNVKKQIESLRNHRRSFTMRAVDVKIGNQAAITITEANKDQYLDELNKLRGETNLSKDQTLRRNALSAAFLDYEMMIKNDLVYEKYITYYESALNILNLATIRADDYAINTLSMLYAFRAYINDLIPQKASESLELEFKKLDGKLTKTKSDIEDENKKLTDLQTKQKELESKFDIEYLNNDAGYQTIKKDIDAVIAKLDKLETARKELEGYTSGNKRIKGKIQINREDYRALQKRIRAGEKDPTKLIAGFVNDKLDRALEVMNEIQRVNFLNGIKFQIDYTDANGKKVTVDVNENITKEFFIDIYKNAKEINDVGIVLKDNFQTQVNKLLNQYLGKDVFEDLLNFNHKFFDIDLKQWTALSKANRVKTLVAYINESNLDQADKDKLLESYTLRKIYASIEAVSQIKTTSTTTILADNLTTSMLYRYVMQEQMKLYKNKTDLNSSTNPIVLAFKKAAELLKELDDDFAKTTNDLTNYQKELLDDIRNRFEINLKNTPIYRYVKTYLYDYVDHDKNKLTLFKRSSISEILPDDISKYDIQQALKNKAIATSIVNDLMESEFVDELINIAEPDIKGLRDASIVRFKMNAEDDLTPEDEGVRVQTEERFNKAEAEREQHRLEKERIVSLYDESASDSEFNKKLTEDQRSENVITRIKDAKYGPITIRTALDYDISKLPSSVNQRRELALVNIVQFLLDPNRVVRLSGDQAQGRGKVLKLKQPFVLLPPFIQYSLNMSLFYDVKNSKDVNILQLLKNNARSTSEYEEQVNVFSFKIALLIKKYPELLTIADLKIKSKDSRQTIAKEISKLYLKNGKVDVRVNLTKRIGDQRSYTAMFKSALINVAKKRLGADATNIDARKYLLKISEDQNKFTELNDIVRETNKVVHAILNKNKYGSLFLDTLNELTVDLRRFESSLKKSISDYNASLNPSIRKKAIAESQEIREIFKDLASAKEGARSNQYGHIMFKLLNAVSKYYQEDYANKTTLRSFDNFNRIEQRDGEIIFKYQTEKMNKAIEYTMFDLIFIHGVTRRDVLNLVTTIGNRMAALDPATKVTSLEAAAVASYDMLIQEFGTLLTYNSFSIDKEIFMKQPGATEELYNLFSDPGVIELRQRLLLVNEIFETDLDTNKIDFRAIYDNRFRTFADYIFRAAQRYTAEENKGNTRLPKTYTFKATNKDGTVKDLFTVDLLDNKGVLRNNNTLLLLTLLKLSQINPKDFEGYTIKSPEGNEQSVIVSPSNIKQIIRDIFFKDRKTVKGLAQDSNLTRIEERIADAKEDLATFKKQNIEDKDTPRYKRYVNRVTTKIGNLQAVLKHYTEINKRIELDAFADFDTIYTRMQADDDLAQDYFNNTVDTDLKDYVLGIDPTGADRLYRRREVFKDRTDVPGIPKLNLYFVRHVFGKNDKKEFNKAKDNLTANEQTKNADLRIVTEDGTAVFVVPDEQWSFGGNESLAALYKRVMNGEEYNISEVFILSETKYNEIEDIQKNNKDDFDMVDRYTVRDETIKPVPEVLNVQGKKVIVDLWLKDLNLIYKERLDTTNKVTASELLNKLSLFYQQRYTKKNLQGFVPILKSYGEGTNLFNTETFRRIQEEAKLNNMFFDFYDRIKGDYDLETIGVNFFKGKFIKKGYDLSKLKKDLNDPVLVANLVQRGLFDKIIKALTYMQKTYGDDPLVDKINYYNVLKPETTSEILRLKNSIYGIVKHIEKTNKIAYKKIIPIIQQHIKTQFSEDTASQNVLSFLEINKELTSPIVTDLEKVFRDPYKKRKKSMLELFKASAYNRYGSADEGISLLNAQQYHLKNFYDIIQEARKRHYKLIAKHNKDTINYSHLSSLKNAWKDWYKDRITLDELYAQLEKIIPLKNFDLDLKPKNGSGIYSLAEKIYNSDPTRKDFKSPDDIVKHIVYGYVLKSYLISINQYMNKRVADQLDGFNAVDYLNLLQTTRDELLIKKRNKTISKPEAALLANVEKRLRLSQQITNKKDRYGFNMEHLIFRGDKLSLMFFYDFPSKAEVEKQIKEGTLEEIQDVKIDEYISEHISKKFNIELDQSDRLLLTVFAGDVIETATDHLYAKTTSTSNQYVPKVVTLDRVIKQTEALKEQILSEGFTQDQLQTMIALATTKKNEGVYLTGEDALKDKAIFGEEGKVPGKVNTYINELQRIKSLRYKIKKTKLTYKEIFKVNQIDLLETSTRFFDYFKNVIRNNDFNLDSEEIVRMLKEFGISRDEVFSILEGEYKTIQHFINAHIKTNDPSAEGDDFTKANLLIWFINYHKDQYIRNVLKRPNYTVSLEDIKAVRDFELIREKDNNLRLQTISINNLLGEGNAITNSVNFHFNRGFSILREIDRQTTYYNDRLGRIILDDTNLRDNEEYSGDFNGIIYKQNNIKLVAADTQRTLYEPIFKEGDAGFVGSRIYELMLMRKEFINDMMAENMATNKNVGSANQLYNSLRITWTDLLEKLKKDFKPGQFIRVRDITAAVGLFKKDTSSLNTFIDYYNMLLRDAKEKYILDNAGTKKSPEELSELFDAEIKALTDKIIEVSATNNKIVEFNETFVKGILGYIYLARFVDHTDIPEIQNRIVENVSKQFEDDIKYKSYKYKTITSVIKRIIQDESLTEFQKKKELAKLQGKNDFEELTLEQQQTINMGLRIQKFIKSSENFYNPNQFYDTFDVAYGNKATVGAKTTILSKREAAEELAIKILNDEIKKRQSGLNKTIARADDIKNQEKLFTIPKIKTSNETVNERLATPDYYTYDNKQRIVGTDDLYKQADLASFILQEKITEADKLIAEEEKTFKEKKLELIKALFTNYPGLRNYYMDQREAEIKLLIEKEEGELLKLNSKTDNKYLKEYDAYLKDVEDVKKIEDSVEYKVNSFYWDTYLQLRREGVPPTEALKTIYSFFKEELLELKISTEAEFITLHNKTIKEKVFENLNKIRDRRDARGRDSEGKLIKKYTAYAAKRAIHERNLQNYEEELTSLQIDDFENVDTALETLSKIIKDFKEESKSVLAKTFKAIDDKGTFTKLSDTEKALITKRHKALYNKQLSYLKVLYGFIRDFNVQFGIAGKKDLGVVKNDKLISLDVLTKAVQNEISILRNHANTLANRRIVDIPEAVDLPKLEGEEEFKLNLYFTVFNELKINKRSSDLKRELTDAEAARIENETREQFKDITPLTAFNLIFNFIKHPNNYDAISKSFGSKQVELDFSDLADDKLRFAQALLANVNNALVNKFNISVEYFSNKFVEYINKAEKTIGSIGLEKTLLDRKGKVPTVSDLDHAKKLFSNLYKDIEGEAIDNMDDQTVASLIRFVTNSKDNFEIKNYKRYKKQFLDKLKNVNDFKQALNDLPKRREGIETLKADLEIKKEALEKTKADRQAAYNKELEVAGDKLSNLDLFKHYYKARIKKDAAEIDVINIVLKIVQEKFPGQDIEFLKTFIKSRGDYALHNSVVDSLITLLNYIHQKPASKNFIVIDLETYRYNGEDTPYQITMITVKDKQLIINDVYINSGLFYDGVNDDGSYKENMLKFYEQQKRIWKKQWEKEDLSPEEFEVKAKIKMDELIARVKQVKNNDNFINTFIQKVGDANVDIVAHNGFRFDFNIIKNFISRIGDNLIVNEYYRNLSEENSLETIFNKIDKTELDADEITTEYIKELQEASDRLIKTIETKKEFITKQELDRIKEDLDRINNKITALKINQAIKKASEQTGYILNDDIKNQIFDVSTGAIKYLRDQLTKYFDKKVTDAIKTEIKNDLVLRFMEGITLENKTPAVEKIIIEYVDKLIKGVEKNYNETLNGAVIKYGATSGVGVRSELKERAIKLAGVKLYDKDVELNIKESIEILDALQAANSTLAEVLKTGLTSEEIVLQKQKEIEKKKETIRKHKETISRLREEVAAKVISDDEIVKQIISSAQKIDKLTTSGYGQTVSIALNSVKEIRSSTTATKELGLLETQKEMADRDLKLKLSNIIRLAAAIRSGKEITDYKVFLEGSVDTRILDVLNKSITKEDALKAINEELKALSKQTVLREDGKLEDAVVETFLKNILKDYQDELKVYLKQTYTKLVEALTNLLKIKTFKGISIANNNILFENKPIDLISLRKMYGVITDSENQEDYQKYTAAFTKVLNLLENYEENLSLSQISFEDLIKETTSTKLVVFNEYLNDRKNGLLQAKAWLENYVESDLPGKTDLNVLLLTYSNVMESITGLETKIENLSNETIYSLITGEKPSNRMNDQQFDSIASSTLDLKEVFESATLKRLGLKVHYDDPEKGNDILAIRTVHNTVLSKAIRQDNAIDNTYLYSVSDDEYNLVSTASFNAKKNRIEIKLRYGYIPAHLKYDGGSTAGFQTLEKNINVYFNSEDAKFDSDFTFKELENLLDEKKFYWTKDGKAKYSILPNVRRDEVFYAKGVDSGKAASDVLIKFLIKNKDNFRRVNSKTEASKITEAEEANEAIYQKTLTHEKFAANSKYLRVLNISEMIRNQFFAEVALYQKQRQLTERDLKTIYIGIYNRLTSRYKALEPGSIVNQINADYTYDYNIESFDDAFLKENNIDLQLNSEGSAGAVLKYKTRYALNFPFLLSTNAIRTMLSAKHLLAKYTSLKFLNNIYGDIPDKVAPGKKLLTTFLSNPGKYIKNKEVINNFVRLTKSANTQIFMPNVMSKSLYKSYKDDTEVHQFGFTVPIAFANDPRIPLDEIAVDADFYYSTEYGNGNKTWLGLHSGFKGAVRPIQGLYKTYGALFVASANSVNSRGTAGIYGEMLFNYIRAYLLNETKKDGSSLIPARTLRFFKAIDPYLRKTFGPLLNKEDNVLLVDSSFDSYELLEGLSKEIKDKLSNDEEFKSLITDTTKDTELYNVLILRDFKEEDAEKDVPAIITPAYIKTKSDQFITEDYDMNKVHERRLIKTDLTATTYVRGLAYVYADHENSAQAMATQTKFNTAGKLIRNVVDSNNNPIKGTYVSPTVSIPIINKIGLDNFNKVFGPNNDNLNLLSNIRSLGFKTVIKNATGLEDEEEVNTVERLEELQIKLTEAYQKKEIHEYVREQGMQYLNYLYLRNTTSGPKEGYNKNIDRIVKNTESNALKKMYSGKNSAYYQSRFKRIDGVRAQYLVDVTLDAGEITLPKDAWDAIVVKDSKEGNTLIKTEPLNAKKSKEYIDTILGFENIEQRIEFLNSRGILAEENGALHLAVESGTNKLDGYQLNQTYTYVLAVRSPVQDYAATPVLKAIGFSTSYAVNVNVYAYNMMGADNDGDTMGMGLLKFSDVEGDNAPLRELLATDLNYYSIDEEIDKKGNLISYLEKANRELFAKDKVENDQHFMSGAKLISYSVGRNQRGKNTLNKDIRGEEGEYLNVEMYRLISGDTYNQLAKSVENNLEPLDTNDVDTLRLYVNAHVRINNEGNDVSSVEDTSIQKVSDYFNVDKLKDYYDTFKDEIDTIYTIEKNFNSFEYGEDIIISEKLKKEYLNNFTQEEQDILNNTNRVTEEDKQAYRKYYKRLVLLVLSKKLEQSTTGRIRASKNGVNYAGNKRKDQFTSSIIAEYKHINKSKQGIFWKAIGATNTEGEVTVRSLLATLADEAKAENVNYEELYNILNGLTVEEVKRIWTEQSAIDIKYFLRDTEHVLKDLRRLVKTMMDAESELENLSNFMDRETITVKDYLEFVENSSIKNEPVIKNYIENFRNSKSLGEELGASFKKELLFYYFRGSKAAEEFLRRVDLQKLTKGYLDQYFIERVANNNMSNLIQETISMAKHDGIDSNSNERYIRFTRKVDNITTRKSVRNIILGSDTTEAILGRAINADRDFTERLDIKEERITSASLNKEYYEENPGSRIRLQESYDDEASAKTAIKNLIKERLKLYVFGNLYMPDEITTLFYKRLSQLNKALSNPNDYAINKKDLEESINFFNGFNIPFYKLIGFMRSSLSIVQVVNERYSGAKNINFNSIDSVKNASNILRLFYALRNPDFKQAFDKRYKSNNLFFNFFNNVNAMDEGWFIVDEEGNRVFISPEDDASQEIRDEGLSMEEVQIAVSAAGTNNNEVISKTQEELSKDTYNKVTNALTSKLQYATFDSETTKVNEFIGNLKTDIELLLIQKEEVIARIKEIKKLQADLNLKSSAQLKLQNPRVKNARLQNKIKNGIGELNALQNRKRAIELEIKDLEKAVKAEEVKLSAEEKSLLNTERIKEWYENNEDPIAKLEEENRQIEEAKQELRSKALENALINNLGGGILLLRTVDGYGLGDSNVGKPRYLTQEDLDSSKVRARLAMANDVTLLTNMINPNNLDVSLKIVYEFLRTRQQDYRLVIVKDPYKDEGAYKSIVDNIRRFDPKKDSKDQLYTQFTEKEIKALKFKTLEELEAYQKEGGKVVYNGKVYDQIDPTVVLKDNRALTPTYKEIKINSIDELRTLYNAVKDDGTGAVPIVGFVDLNTWIQAMETTYTSRRKPAGIELFAYKLQLLSKNISKFSAAFLFRNLNDTVYQLFSNAQILPKTVESNDFIHMTMTSLELMSYYEKYSDEHTASIINIGLHYEDIIKELKSKVRNPKLIESRLGLMKEVLESYVAIGATKENESPRIKYYLPIVKRLLKQMNLITIKNIDKYTNVLYDAAKFVSNIRFGEFIELYDNQEINGKWVAGLRVDARDENGKVRKGLTKLGKAIFDDKNKWKKTLLKQLSAFMNTAATSDYLRKDNFELLPEVFANYKGYDENDLSSKSYEEIKKMIADARKDRKLAKGFGGPFRGLTASLIDGYDRINTFIENGARVTNFLYNLMIYNKSFDESVLASLRSWFNYGLRSPLEQRLMADIPFISFPVRSITNWIHRLNSPRWWRFMSDFLDGWYGQYIDEEEKEYNDYIKYQMRNGWIPLSPTFGIRLGNGALDVMNILYNTQEAFEGRMSPILRGVKTLVEKRSVFEALNQLASLGLVGRLANTVTGVSDMALQTNLRQQAAQVPVARELLETRPASIGTTFRGFAYDINNYGKYTPRQYRYGRNGRYAKYENIYRDWFNKYGRMRKPKINPYSLVKDIQWRQYVRWRQSRNVIG